MSDEAWRPIPGYEGAYEASDLGRIRSLDRITDRGRRWKGRIMTPTPMRSGYLIVTLWRDGSQTRHLVHRLVLYAFHGLPSPGHETLHANGDRRDNRLANLSWGTHADNQRDQLAHGTHSNASRTHCPAGHPYSAENTYHYPSHTHRACRRCRAEAQRRWREENPERWREISRAAEKKYRERKKERS